MLSIVIAIVTVAALIMVWAKLKNTLNNVASVLEDASGYAADQAKSLREDAELEAQLARELKLQKLAASSNASVSAKAQALAAKLK